MNTRHITLGFGASILLALSACATQHDFLSSKLGQQTYSCDAKEMVLETKKGNVKVKRGERTGADVNTEFVTWYCGHPAEANAHVISCDAGTDLVEVARNHEGADFVAYCYAKTGKL